jgi:hypothetical protein
LFVAPSTYNSLAAGDTALITYTYLVGDGNDRVIAQSGVSDSESSGDQIDLCYLNTIFELYPSYHLGQVLEAA